MPKGDWVFWLNVTNFALGAVVFLAVAAVAYAVVYDLVGKYKKAHSTANIDNEMAAMLQFGRTVPGLGVTMADGGDPIKSQPEHPEEKKPGRE
jgi:hypothetical protein